MDSFADISPLGTSGFDSEGNLVGRGHTPELELLRALVREAVALQGTMDGSASGYSGSERSATSGRLSGLKRAIAHVLVYHYGRDLEDALEHVERLVSETTIRFNDQDPEWPEEMEEAVEFIVSER